MKQIFRIGNMKANAMEEFDNWENFEITFFAGMEGGGIENGIGIFDVVDFMSGERRVNNILSEIEQSLIIIFLDGGDKGGFKRFMGGENGAKELIDSFSRTLCLESEQFSIATEESP